MEYKNISMFFIPIKIDDYNKTKEVFDKEENWERINEYNKPSYMLPYVAKISENEDLFFTRRLIKFDEKRLYSHKKWLEENKGIKKHPKLIEIRYSCFSTKIAFLEYWFEYGNFNHNDLLEFSYCFKKAKKQSDWKNDEDELPLYDYSKEIMPSGFNYDLFFTSKADFKYECKCFHTYRFGDESIDEDSLKDFLHRLARTYNTSFPSAESDGKNDMVFSPYSYDRWSGSTEALANVVLNTTDIKAQTFIDSRKYEQILSDYHFMYLVLLNQRFSLLNYIDSVSSNSTNSRKIEEISKESMNFKAYFSFRVVSDDLLYQSIYSKMYDVLEINELLQDTTDNENIASSLLSESSKKAEGMIEKAIIVLSGLTVFSTLIDASSFFDRFGISNTISSFLSIGITCGIILLFVIIYIIKRK